MVWWKSDNSREKTAKKRGFWENPRDYEYVEAKIYEPCGKKSELPLMRDRRFNVNNRHTYR